MLDFLIYDAKVAVLIAVFYMFYRLLLARETFHRVNRVVLLLTTVLSFVLPLCVITMHETMVAPMPSVTIGEMRMAGVEEPSVPWWHTALPTLFIIGMVATLGHTLASVVRVLLLIRRSERHPQEDGTTLCVVDRPSLAPFSWMSYIVLNRDDYANHNAAVLAHERGHIHLRHSWDLLLVDTLTALQWPNPAMWMLRQDLRAIHEYEADGVVLSQGFNARQYQYLLITKAASIGGYSIAPRTWFAHTFRCESGISHSTLKNRIHMMLHKKSRRSHLLKLLALVPIIGTTLALNARTVTDFVYDEPQKKQIIKKGRQNATVKTGSINEIVVVEQAPKAEATAEDGNPFTVKGKVVDDAGKPVVGAVVLIDGSKKGSVTDVNGAFTIEAREGDNLSISYVGMGTAHLTVSKASAEKHEYDILMCKEDTGDGKVFDVVEQMPAFPGGHAALMQYLAQNIRYPEEAHKNNIQGRVIVNFIVGEDGSISDAKVIRSIHPLLDEEALRVINSMPNWIPGMANGEKVRVKYVVPVTFRLQGEKSPSTEQGDPITFGPEQADYVVDGKLIDGDVFQMLKSSDIKSMTIEKPKKNGEKVRILITTKKNKE